MIDCLFCASQLRDLFGLALHLEDNHPDDQHLVGVHVARGPHSLIGVAVLPVVEVDIDAVNRNPKFKPKKDPQ